MDLKTGMLMLLVGLAVIGMTVSSVNAADHGVVCKDKVSSHQGSGCTVTSGGQGSCYGSVYSSGYWYWAYDYNDCMYFYGKNWVTC